MEGTFPPLAGNPDITGADYVAGVVRNGKQGPITVNGVSYDGVMPPIANLTDAQIEAVAAYVAGLASTAAPPTSAPGPVTGDAAQGQSLFIGRVRFAAGGATCGSCHTIGSYGGGSLGPDLSGVFTRLGGEAALTGWLKSPPAPAMQPIFSAHPLEDTEIADLIAFLSSVDSAGSNRGPDMVLMGAALGSAALLGVMGLAFTRSRGKYVDRLRSKP